MRRFFLAAFLLVAPLAGACAGDGNTRLTVFAASSLTDAFTALAGEFEEANPGVTVSLSVASSSALAVQVREGADADVLASADPAILEALARDGHALAPAPFATNELVVVVPAGDGPVDSFADLARPGLRLVLAAPEVPAGAYARQALERASTPSGPGATFATDVLANLRSNETSVRAVLAKVELGEADAGIVYRTDIAAASNVRTIEIPPEFNVTAAYLIAALTHAPEPEHARAFVEFALSPQGQAVLARFGFGPPQ